MVYCGEVNKSIVETLQRAARFRLEKRPLENDGGGDHGSRQGAAPGFVHAGHAHPRAGPSFPLVAEQGDGLGQAWTSFRRLCLLVRLRR